MNKIALVTSSTPIHISALDLNGDTWPLTKLDKAFAQFLQKHQPSDNPHHALLAALTSYQFSQGHSCLDLQMLVDDGAAFVAENVTVDSEQFRLLAEAAASLPWVQGDNSPLVLDGQRLYLRRNWNAEHSIREAIAARLAEPCDPPENLPGLLESLFPAKLAPDNEPDWQKIACALATRKRLTLITGGPGTGKTTTVVRLLALLQHHARAGDGLLRIALAAPTGKAAARLSESIANTLETLPESMRGDIPQEAVTLHRLLGVGSNNAGDSVTSLPFDLVVVDEASMIDLEMMARLLVAVPLTASLILLGDKDQLASVEAGAVMGQLCEGADSGNYDATTRAWLARITGDDLQQWAGEGSALAQQTVMLRQSRRFSNPSGIGLWAKALNAGDVAGVQSLWLAAQEVSDGPATGQSDNAEVFRISEPKLNNALLVGQIKAGWQDWLAGIHAVSLSTCSDAAALALLQDFAKFQVLCAVRAGPWGVGAVNRQVAMCLGFDATDWYAGRPVMVTRNDYSLKLMNGDVGLCLSRAGGEGLAVAFPDGRGGVRWILPSRLDAVETVFAMTVHKSQGSEFNHVLVVLPDRAAAVLTRELLYTAITRAKQRLTLLVPSLNVLLQATVKKVLRSGGLV